MDALQFLRSSSDRLEAIANQLVETGLTMNGKPKQPSKAPTNQTVVANLKKCSPEELADIIDVCGWSEEFESASSNETAQAQVATTVDLSAEEHGVVSVKDKKGNVKEVPVVYLPLEGLSNTGSSLTFAMKSGKTAICRSSKLMQLFLTHKIIKVGDMVPFNPTTIAPASYAHGYYDAGCNISAIKGASALYQARGMNKALSKAKIAEYIDSGMSPERAVAKVDEGVEASVTPFKPFVPTFD